MASIGNAASLRGGKLLMTPLRGVDGQVYAIAQGSLVVSGFGVNGKDGSRISLNVPEQRPHPERRQRSSARCRSQFARHTCMLNLNTPDFTTAARVAAGNQQDARRRHAPTHSTPCRSGSSHRSIPTSASPTWRLLESIEVEPGEAPARVIINSRTGTVVISSHVR